MQQARRGSLVCLEFHFNSSQALSVLASDAGFPTFAPGFCCAGNKGESCGVCEHPTAPHSSLAWVSSVWGESGMALLSPKNRSASYFCAARVSPVCCSTGSELWVLLDVGCG